MKKEIGKIYHFNNKIPELKRYGFIRVLQVGELNCKAEYEVLPHTQECSEISYIVSGAGTFTVNGTRYPVKAGDVVVNQIGDIHAIQADSDTNLCYFFLGFLLDDRLDGCYCTLSQFFSALPDIRLCQDQWNIRYPFSQLINEFYLESACAQLEIESLLNEILILTYRNFQNTPTNLCTIGENRNVTGNVVYRTVRYIDMHAAEITEVKEITKALGYSSSYLSHLFREQTGETIQRYLSQKKIEKSLALIHEGRYTLTQIAMQLGYDTQQSFSKAFHRVMNMSPTEYAALDQGGRGQPNRGKIETRQEK